jgi:hypothetical protein
MERPGAYGTLSELRAQFPLRINGKPLEKADSHI